PADEPPACHCEERSDEAIQMDCRGRHASRAMTNPGVHQQPAKNPSGHPHPESAPEPATGWLTRLRLHSAPRRMKTSGRLTFATRTPSPAARRAPPPDTPHPTRIPTLISHPSTCLPTTHPLTTP